jgi:hypothetical protein
VERLKRVRGLDLSAVAKLRERLESGAEDARRLAEARSSLAEVERALNQPMSARTRAALRFVEQELLGEIAILERDPARLVRQREAALEAMKLWPGLQLHDEIASAYLEEAGLVVVGESWVGLRRTVDPALALERLEKADPLAAARLRGSEQWRFALDHARQDRSRPAIADLRFARLAGDPALEERCKPVHDDRLQRLRAELTVLLDPASEIAKADLAALAR